MFVNTSEIGNRAAVLKPIEQIEALDDNSTDILYSNHLKRYVLRPKSLTDLCLANWFSLFISESNFKPPKSGKLPDNIYKLSDGSFVRRLKETSRPRIIRYVRYSFAAEPENHYRELLMLFYPYFNEKDLLMSERSYETAYRKVAKHVESNRLKYEPFRGAVDVATEEVQNDVMQQIRSDEAAGEIFAPNVTHYDDEDVTTGSLEITHVVPDDDVANKIKEIIVPGSVSNYEFVELISSLNPEQQVIFYEILCRVRNRIRNSTFRFLIPFVSGGAGAGKSYLLKCLFQALYRLLESPYNDPEKPTVAIAAYTGVAARNVGGATLHSLLGFKFGTNPIDVRTELSAGTLQDYRNALC